MLAISALVLVSAYIAWVPVPFVMELGRKNSFIGNWGAGAFTLGWVGIAGTLGCCALTVQASVGKKVLTLIVLGLAAVGQIIWSIDIISTNLAQKPMMLPASMGYVFFFLKLGSILIAALSLRGWPRWTVIGLGIAAMFSSAVGDGIGIALDKKALTASIGLEWARWLAYAGFSVLAFGAAAVSLFAVFRKPAQATPEPSASASPTTPATASTAQASRHQPTSRVLYVVLGLFFGCLGVHNFLAGYTRKGIIQLLITLCTFFFGAFFVAIWALIEIFTVKADADGVPFT
jgi:TM2 domain-containing membrane protein YozV